MLIFCLSEMVCPKDGPFFLSGEKKPVPLYRRVKLKSTVSVIGKGPDPVNLGSRAERKISQADS